MGLLRTRGGHPGSACSLVICVTATPCLRRSPDLEVCLRAESRDHSAPAEVTRWTKGSMTCGTSPLRIYGDYPP